MSFGSRLKERREYLGLSRNDLAKRLDVTASAIGNYENGVSSPKENILYKIFKALDIDPNYLWQDEMKSLVNGGKATSAEMEYIKKYRALDEHGKDMVKTVIEKEYERYLDTPSIPLKIAAHGGGVETQLMTPREAKITEDAIAALIEKHKDDDNSF